jgi:hypothetical protein
MMNDGCPGISPLDEPRTSSTKMNTDLDRSRIRSDHPGMAQSAARQLLPASSRSAQQRRTGNATKTHHVCIMAPPPWNAEILSRQAWGMVSCYGLHLWTGNSAHEQRRTRAGQLPDKHRPNTEPIPNELRTKLERCEAHAENSRASLLVFHGRIGIDRSNPVYPFRGHPKVPPIIFGGA